MKILFLTILSMISLNSFAQRKADKVVTFDNNIESLLLNPFTGNVIVKEQAKVSSYNPQTDTKDWSLDKASIYKEDASVTANKVTSMLTDPETALLNGRKDVVEYIPNSPFISMIVENKDIIINANNGKVVFNSGDTNYRLLKSKFIVKEKAFLFTALKDSKISFVYYDLASRSEKWRTEITDFNSFKDALGSMIPIPGRKEKMKDKIEVRGNDIYTAVNGKLYKIDKTNGKILWNTDFSLTEFYLSQTGNNIIAIRDVSSILKSKKALNILDASNGQKIWKDDITTSYISYIEDWTDRILVAHSNGFNFYSYKDGKKIWKKDAKGDKIKKVIAIGEDYLYIADKDMNLIDKDGKSKWKKTIEICDNSEDEVFFMDKVDNNRVFYLTDTYGNMVDYTSGKKIWKKNIKFEKKAPLLYDYDNTKKVFIVYNNKKLYKFDPNATDAPESFAKLKVEDDKAMSSIEMFDWGVSLVGQSDAIGVGYDGVTKYQHKYKEPGGGQRKFLKSSLNVGSSLFGMSSSIKNGVANATVTYRGSDGKIYTSDLLSQGAKDKLNNSAASDAAMAAGIDQLVAAKLNTRFNALKENSNYAYILAKAEDGKPELIKLRKADGVEVDKIAIDNTKPIYEVDPATDDVFYANKNELRIYNKQ